MDLQQVLESYRRSFWKKTYKIKEKQLVHNSGLAKHATEFVDLYPRKRTLVPRRTYMKNNQNSRNNTLKTLNEEHISENAETDFELPKEIETIDESELDKKLTADQTECDIAFIYVETGPAYFVNNLLRRRSPDIKTNFKVVSDGAQWDHLDSAKLVVVFLSYEFVISQKHVEEFHVALARHRKSEDQPVLYPVLVGDLPKMPTYFRLVPCRIASYNKHWYDLMEGVGDSGGVLVDFPIGNILLILVLMAWHIFT